MRAKLEWRKLVAGIGLAASLALAVKMAGEKTRLPIWAEGKKAEITVDVSQTLGPLPKPWEALAQGGDNLAGFLDGVESEVRALRPQYIRIDHIYTLFDVVGRKDGKLVYNWEKLDKAVGKIMETGAKPFLSLSYMPEALAVTDIVSEPKDWDEWSELVQKTIERYSGFWGIEDVYYEVWNEPDLFGQWRLWGNKDYRKLYFHAARGAARARVGRNFKLGGPATTGLYRNWMDQFLTFARQNRLRLDFFSWHRYDWDLTRYQRDLAEVNEWLERHPNFFDAELVISEFGPEAKPGGKNDTRQGAAHLVALAREMLGKASWGFTFAVSGQWGIIGKPRYQALALMAELGTQRLPVSGEGTWVRGIAAEAENKHQLLLTNYDPRWQNSEVVPVIFAGLERNRYLLRERFLGGGGRTIEVATNAGVWQHNVPMPPNSVVLVELIKR